MSDKIDVTTKHPDYEKLIKKITIVEDCIAGEMDIKEKMDEYLPRPSGMDSNTMDGIEAYSNYIKRAHFPDFTAKFLFSLVGISKINKPKIELPDKISYIIDNCDGNGTSLDKFFSDSIRLSLSNGRQLIFVDVDDVNNRLKLVRYRAEQIINWGVVNRVDNGVDFDFIVIEEPVNVVSDNIFGHNQEYLYRVLSTNNIFGFEDNNGFLSLLFDKNSNIISSIQPSLMGRKWKYGGIPGLVIGSSSIGTSINSIPLLGVANCALQSYMKDADLSNSMFLTCNPTLCMSGISQTELSEGPVKIGSNIAIISEDSSANVYYTKTDASALAEMRLAKDTYTKEAYDIGASLLTNMQKGVESEGALRIKANASSATLSSVVQVCAEGFEKLLKNIAKWNNIDESMVSMEIDMNYVDNMLSTKEVETLLKLYLSNVITLETMLSKLIDGNILNYKFDVKNEVLKIKNNSRQTN